MNTALLHTLAKIEGFESVDALLEAAMLDSVCPGICPHCDYTTEVEPDQLNGWRESCNANTVESALVLARVIPKTCARKYRPCK